MEDHGTTRLATAISPPAGVHGKQLHHELRHAVALSGIWLTRLGKTITEERTVTFFFPWQQQRSLFFPWQPRTDTFCRNWYSRTADFPNAAVIIIVLNGKKKGIAVQYRPAFFSLYV
jgi:hypothetical protein